MNQPETQAMVSFLVTCSRTSLGNFLLAKQSRASNLERQLRDVIGNLVETVAFIELANILRDHGEEIVGTARGQGLAGLPSFPKVGPVKVKALARCHARKAKI